MKNIRLIATLIFSIAPIFVHAQNHGFVGKKNALGFGVEVNNLTLRGNGIPKVVLQYERTRNLKHSYNINLSFKRMVMDYEETMGISNFFSHLYPTGFDRSDVNFTNGIMKSEFKSNLLGLELSRRSYFLYNGSMAPYGLFFEFGIIGNYVILTDVEATVEASYRDEPMVIQMKYLPRLKQSLVGGASVSFGEKRFLDKKRYLEYRVGFNLDGTSSIGALNHMAHAQNHLNANYLRKSFIHLNFTYGFGY